MTAHECGLTDTHCCIHHIDEGWDETSYLWCMECGHVYQTEQELVDAYNRKVSEMNREMGVFFSYGTPLAFVSSAEDIHFCQYCLHDFY